MRAWILVIALLVGSAPAWADFSDGNRLHKSCHDLKGHGLSYCQGYVAAIADTRRSDGRAGGDGAWLFYNRVCISRSVKVTRLVEVVREYLDQHEERRHISAKALVSEALSGGFPCPR